MANQDDNTDSYKKYYEAAPEGAPALDLHKELPISACVLTPPEEKPQYFTYDNFTALELRFGTIISAERLPKSKKLFKLMVDLGEATHRQILAGIGETFETDAIVGKQYLFVANLPPRKMMGVESNGMILAAGEPTSLTLVSPTSPVPAGARIQ